MGKKVVKNKDEYVKLNPLVDFIKKN